MSEFVDAKTLRKAQLEMLKILIHVDRVCQENNIDYWLDAGTLLGAVRHGGFIPWDDDIDICMRRSDFNKFLELKSEFTDKLYVQLNCGVYKNGNNPCKIRLKDTKFVELSDSNINISNDDNGIFVDIFPVDKFSQKKYVRKIQRLPSVLFYLKFSTKFIKHKNNLRKIISKASFLIPWVVVNAVHKMVVNYSEKIETDYQLGFGVETLLGYLGHTEEKDLYPLKKLSFEGYDFYVPNAYQKWLRVRYGEDYMVLPPESKRTWHAIKIELEE
ncbi:LicD family protein [Vibrio harveyi]|uniref:LicD family protein n=1 Tax=Vibrio harveyi TaxID=669 RepID=UPI0018F1AEDA|nr:LicD family protein [Vibrio harveyi]CAH1547083.1 LicD family protein [Vibrio harveyi]